MIIAFWILFSLLVGSFAQHKGRSFIIWTISSLLISPLLSFIFLLVFGSAHPKCPSCKSEVKVGTKVCGVCKTAFQTEAKPDSELKIVLPKRVAKKASEEKTKATKDCPFCAETIKAAAILCRYCGKDLPNPNNYYSNSKEQKNSKSDGQEEPKDSKPSMVLLEESSPQVPKELSGTNEGQLIEGIYRKNWGKVSSAITLGADLGITVDGKSPLELANLYADSAIISLLERETEAK